MLRKRTSNKNKLYQIPHIKVLIHMCGETGETISHIVSECLKLAQRRYKRRNDNAARMFH